MTHTGWPARRSRRVLLAAPLLAAGAAIGMVASGVTSASAQSTATTTPDITAALTCPGQVAVGGFAITCSGDGAKQVGATVIVRQRKDRREAIVELTAAAPTATAAATTTIGPVASLLGDNSTTFDVTLSSAPSSTATAIATSTVHITATSLDPTAPIAGDAAAKPKPPATPTPTYGQSIELLSFAWGH